MNKKIVIEVKDKKKTLIIKSDCINCNKYRSKNKQNIDIFICKTPPFVEPMRWQQSTEQGPLLILYRISADSTDLRHLHVVMSVCMMAGTPPDNFFLPIAKCSGAAMDEFSRLHILKSNNQISWLQTILRNVKTSHGDFVFNADRLVCN